MGYIIGAISQVTLNTFVTKTWISFGKTFKQENVTRQVKLFKLKFEDNFYELVLTLQT